MRTGSRSPVYLINPPSAPGTTANREGVAGLGNVYPREGAYLYPPLTIAYAGSALRAAGYQPLAIDAVVERLDNPGTAKMIGDGSAILGVLTSVPTLETDLAFVRFLKQSHPRSRVVVFGNATRSLEARLLDEPAVDRVLLGEVEGFLPEVCAELEEGGKAKASPADRVREGGLIATLDSLPLPAWDLLPYSKYQFLSLSASRGCPDDCTYCPYVAAQGTAYRSRTPESVVDEFSWLAATFAPGKIVFRDPAFALQRSRVERISQLLADRRLQTAWECESRPEHFDRELLVTLKKSGCAEIKIGVESTDGDLLQSFSRLKEGQPAQDYARHVARLISDCNQLQLGCRAFVLLGLPGQTESSIRETKMFLQQFPPSSLNVKLFERHSGIRLEAVGGEAEGAGVLDRVRLESLGREMAAAVGTAIFKRGLREDKLAAFRTVRSQTKKRLRNLLN